MAVFIAALKKRAFLRWIYNNAVANASTLWDALNDFQSACMDPVRTGQIALSISGGGYSTNLKLPSSISQLTEEELLGLSEQFILIYQNAILTLAAENVPITSPTDAQIFATMLDADDLTTCRQTVHDITLIRYPGYGPAVQ